MTARNCSSVIFTIRASRVMPALLTSTSTSPRGVDDPRAVLGVGDVGDDARPTDGSRSTRSTSWSPASRSATARPIPRAAPVTIAAHTWILPTCAACTRTSSPATPRPASSCAIQCCRSSGVGVRADRDRVRRDGPRRPACACRSAARWPGSRPARRRWPSRSSWESTKTIGSSSRAASCARRNASVSAVSTPAKSSGSRGGEDHAPPAACSAGSCPSASSGSSSTNVDEVRVLVAAQARLAPLLQLGHERRRRRPRRGRSRTPSRASCSRPRRRPRPPRARAGARRARSRSRSGDAHSPPILIMSSARPS